MPTRPPTLLVTCGAREFPRQHWSKRLSKDGLLPIHMVGDPCALVEVVCDQYPYGRDPHNRNVASGTEPVTNGVTVWYGVPVQTTGGLNSDTNGVGRLPQCPWPSLNLVCVSLPPSTLLLQTNGTG